MKKIIEVLRLKHEANLSHEKIARACQPEYFTKKKGKTSLIRYNSVAYDEHSGGFACDRLYPRIL